MKPVDYKDLIVGRMYSCHWSSTIKPLIFIFQGTGKKTHFLTAIITGNRNIEREYGYGPCASGRGHGEGNTYYEATEEEAILLRNAIPDSTPTHHFNYLP
jgi:hypothetical protein